MTKIDKQGYLLGIFVILGVISIVLFIYLLLSVAIKTPETKCMKDGYIYSKYSDDKHWTSLDKKCISIEEEK